MRARSRVSRRQCFSLGDLHEDFVGLTMPSAMRAFLPPSQAFLQVTHLGGQQLVGVLGARIGGRLRRQLALHGCHVAQAAAAEPQLGVHDQQQRDENGWNDAITQDMWRGRAVAVRAAACQRRL